MLAMQSNGHGLAYQIVKLDSGHTLIDTRDDLLCDCSCVDMFRIKSVTQPRHAGCDLVELHSLLASIYESVSVVSIQYVLAGIFIATRAEAAGTI